MRQLVLFLYYLYLYLKRAKNKPTFINGRKNAVFADYRSGAKPNVIEVIDREKLLARKKLIQL